MTDKEKMQRLFDAALRDPREPEQVKPTPAYFVPASAAPFQPTQTAAAFQPAAFQPAAFPVAGQPMAGPAAAFQAMPAQVPAAAPAQFAVPVAAFVAAPVAQDLVVPMPNAGLDAASSAELAALLDEQHKRKMRRRRREAFLTLLFLFGTAGGGYGWFVQSPQRVQAFNDAIKDIRSAGDIAGIVGKYKKALEKVKVRSEQIDNATVSMGIDPTKDDGKDPYFEEEMKQMMGGEGKTTGERNRLLKEKFGSMEKTGKLGIPAPSSAASIPSQKGH